MPSANLYPTPKTPPSRSNNKPFSWAKQKAQQKAPVKPKGNPTSGLVPKMTPEILKAWRSNQVPQRSGKVPVTPAGVRVKSTSGLEWFLAGILLWVVCLGGSAALIVYKFIQDNDEDDNFWIHIYLLSVCIIITGSIWCYPRLIGLPEMSWFGSLLITIVLFGLFFFIGTFHDIFGFNLIRDYTFDLSCPEGGENENTTCVWFGNYGVYMLFSLVVIFLVCREIVPLGGFWASAGSAEGQKGSMYSWFRPEPGF